VVATPVAEPIDARRDGLEAVELEVRFGGLRAVNGVSLKAPMGQITGLMGPNGAGKTTTFNACSGLNSPQAGRILLHGEDVTRLGSAARGRRGMGRTFQIAELCESLTVAENVALGLEAGLAGSNVLTQVSARRSEAQRTASQAEAALRLCGITHLANSQAGALSTGERRARLAKAIPPTTPGIQIVPAIEVRGEAAFAEACELNLEGVVAKRSYAPYQPGKRPTWRKIRNLRYSRPDALERG